VKKFNNYVNGKWLAANAYRPNRNPSDISDILGEYAQADRSMVEAAIEAANAAFPNWSVTSSSARSVVLEKIGAEILARSQEIGTLLSREEGKTLNEGVQEVIRAGNIFKFFAAETMRIAGEIVPSVRESITVEITREPVGVIGIITPWNYPIAIPAWKIAPALAYGNCVVFKPADLTPGSAWILADILSRSGLPVGVFNLVMGRGSVVGEALATSQDVHAITFTGSQTVGEGVAKIVGARLGKVQLEMGGKNPQVVLDDADLDLAVDASLQSAYFSTGQRCTAASRFIVTKGIHDRFVDALSQKLAKLRVGHALDAGTNIGPVVDESQLESNLAYIRDGVSEGAVLRFGGERLTRETQGYFMSPALFLNTTPSMKINREEIFGPVASVIQVDDYDEALAVANDTPFGLTAGIATTSLKHASHFKRHAQAGMVMINLATAGVDFHVPFGGRKASSYGPREQGKYAAEFFTVLKTSYVASGA
jgi:aldehyde dehydrogenase (NAD+)